MSRNIFCSCLLVLALAGLNGCGSKPPAAEEKKISVVPEKIQGKAQVVLTETTATDNAMNGGGPSVYIWAGSHRYRLFFNKTAPKIEPGHEYVIEGVNAQKLIEEIGDPDQGKNGYPLQSSCERVIGKTWPGLPFDVADGHSTALKNRIKRYPARPVLLVTKFSAVEEDADAAKKKAKEEPELPVIAIPADKLKAQIVESPKSITAPLFEPLATTASCKIIIGKDGKITELETGTQLCEAVPWEDFKFQAPVKGGKPAQATSEIEVKFEPRKQPAS